MDQALTTWPPTRLAAALRELTLPSRELLDAQLGRVETHNAALNAVVTLDVEGARAAAAAADEDAAHGRWRGPLHACRSRLRTPSRSAVCGQPSARPS
jgi:amidase